MTLGTLQADFRDWLATGSDRAAARFAPDAQAGLLVYQNNHRAALLACLAESFPNTEKWLGSENFHACAAFHIDACAPDSWSLDHYAENFPKSLAVQWPDDPAVAELAALELGLAEAFVGPDAAPLQVAALGSIDWDRAMLRWVPTARLLPLRTNAPAIWSAHTSAQDIPMPCLMPQVTTVLIWRQAHIACFRTLDALESEFAHRLLDGMRFDALCRELACALGEAEGVRTAGNWLGRWVADGLVDHSVAA